MTKTAGPTPSIGRSPAPRELEDMLRTAANISSLRGKYADLLQAARPLDLSEVPVLTQAEYHETVRLLLEDPRHRQGAILSAGGGTLAHPELSMLPDDMFAPQLLEQWRPLDGGDVVANLFPAGRLQSAFHFFNVYAALCGATTVPIGHLNDDELGQWLDFLENRGVTALAAPSAVIARVVRMAMASGRSLPWLRKLLLSSVGDVTATAELVARHLPNAEIWGLYCSPASGPIGHNTPACSPDTFHVLPHQYVELDEERFLVTNTHRESTFPLLRFQTGGLGEMAACACGIAEPAIRVQGHSGASLTFRGRTLAAEELVSLACAEEEVAEAQATLVNQGTADEQLCLSVRLHPDVPADQYTCGWIQSQILGNHMTLRGAVDEAPGSFEVVAVERLSGATMVGGAPLLVIAEQVPEALFDYEEAS
ncbi:hypothetical protein OHA37_22340 [Streptomyces sp. NBC_00335]|uniref:hypothetical protein n=1 Tax=unclassified Streptomyces TaxID=2593676 RepID=UPI00225B697E|nr:MULTISPECIES: hypothetical protein [unclassified Streptomyces]MCX5406601.1 hypothetical protein [Streptomyces sp. NBC_00086]